jgi:hypothetical protein
MTNNTTSVNGGAMPKINRATIMARARAIFRIRFFSICRHCFNACLRQAWAEAKSVVGIAAISAEAKADQITTLTDAIEFKRFNEAMRAAISQLSR